MELLIVSLAYKCFISAMNHISHPCCLKTVNLKSCWTKTDRHIIVLFYFIEILMFNNTEGRQLNTRVKMCNNIFFSFCDTFKCYMGNLLFGIDTDDIFMGFGEHFRRSNAINKSLGSIYCYFDPVRDTINYRRNVFFQFGRASF